MVAPWKHFRFIAGFTVLEVTIAMTLLTMIMSIGIPISIDLFRTYTLDADRDTLVTLLERARSDAFANTDARDHGVAITSGNFIGYSGNSYISRDQTKDIIFPRANTVTITGPTEVKFTKLNARVSSAVSFSLTNGAQTRMVTVNEEGLIDW